MLVALIFSGIFTDNVHRRIGKLALSLLLYFCSLPKYAANQVQVKLQVVLSKYQ